MGSVLFRLLVAIALRLGLESERPEAGHGACSCSRRLSLPDCCKRCKTPKRPASPCLRSAAVSKTFNPGTPNEVRALQGVNLTIDDGSFVIIIGTNGSREINVTQCRGRDLFSSIPARSRLAGPDITRWPEHRRAKLIGRVFQNPFSGTAANMSIAENLALAAHRGQTAAAGLAAAATSDQRNARSREPAKHGP